MFPKPPAVAVTESADLLHVSNFSLHFLIVLPKPKETELGRELRSQACRIFLITCNTEILCEGQEKPPNQTFRTNFYCLDHEVLNLGFPNIKCRA